MLPSSLPTSQPSRQPTRQPTGQPSRQPSRQPTAQPSRQPTCQPFAHPSSRPSNRPSSSPTSQPSTSLVEATVFSVTMLYQNLDISDWNADKAYHEFLLSISLVEHVTGLQLNDIVNISAIDESIRRLDNIIKHRVLFTKRLEVDTTFHVRPQYFNRTDSLSVADVYSAVISRINASSYDILLDLQANSTYFADAVLLSTTYSSYTSTIVHSPYPSSSPTSQPTCGTGSYQVGDACGPCARGYFSDSLNAFKCTACPVETYSGSVGSVECSPCEALTTNIKEASSSCPYFTLNASAVSYYTLGIFITVLFLTGLSFAGENVYIMFALGLFPFLDIVSDMIYILSVKFWNIELFFFAIFFFVVPSSMFAYKLARMKAYPRLIKYVGIEIMNDKYIWLTANSDGLGLGWFISFTDNMCILYPIIVYN